MNVGELTPRACATCHTPLPTTTGRGRPRTYCSPECSKASTTRTPRTGHCKRRPCTNCGRPLPIAHRSRTNPTCQRCRRTLIGLPPDARLNGAQYMRHRRNAGLSMSPGNHRARAKRFGVEYQYVDRRRVFTRDRWRCGLCNQPVDKRLKWPDPGCATLDHIIPMACGGGHTYANTQCAHWRCNQAKLAGGGGEQLALVG